jgi:hypothetical protein
MMPSAFKFCAWHGAALSFVIPLFASPAAAQSASETVNTVNARLADSLRREVGALAAQGRLDEAQALVARHQDVIPAPWRAMFAGKLELDGEFSARGYSEAGADSAPEQMRGEAVYRLGQYHYAAGRHNLAIPQFRLYLSKHSEGAWAEASAYWMAHSCLQFARSRADRAGYLDTAEAYLNALEAKGRDSYYWPLARAARARILLERGDSASVRAAAKALRDARGAVPPEEAAGVLLLSLQGRPAAPEAAAWEGSLRWDYPLSPEAQSLPRSTARAATPMPMVMPEPKLPPPAPTPSPKKGGHALQLGAFAQRENAERLRAELATKKIDARIVPLTAAGKTLYRVLAGDYPDAEAARREGEKMGYPFRVVEENAQ